MTAATLTVPVAGPGGLSMVRCVLFISIMLGAGILPGIAAPRDDAFAGISRCGSIQDDRMLLNCIYGAAEPLRAELGLTPAPAFQTKLVPTAQAGPQETPLAAAALAPKKESFLRRLIGEDPISETSIRMASYSFDQRGLFTVTLDNGEIWSQLADDRDLAHWHGSPRDHHVSIQGDVSGANLQVSGEIGTFKVQRLH